MYCPEHILINNSSVMLTMYGSADIPKRYIPLKWWVNPLRYELIFKTSKKWRKINPEGLWRSKASHWKRTLICKLTGHVDNRDSGRIHCGRCFTELTTNADVKPGV